MACFPIFGQIKCGLFYIRKTCIKLCSTDPLMLINLIDIESAIPVRFKFESKGFRHPFGALDAKKSLLILKKCIRPKLVFGLSFALSMLVISTVSTVVHSIVLIFRKSSEFFAFVDASFLTFALFFEAVFRIIL